MVSNPLLIIIIMDSIIFGLTGITLYYAVNKTSVIESTDRNTDRSADRSSDRSTDRSSDRSTASNSDSDDDDDVYDYDPRLSNTSTGGNSKRVNSKKSNKRNTVRNSRKKHNNK